MSEAIASRTLADVTRGLFRVSSPAGPRLARGRIGERPMELLPAALTLDDLLAADGRRLGDAVAASPGDGPCPPHVELLAPIESQEVWCTGVTYERTREARTGGSTEPEIYDRLYDAERPELFFKAPGWRVRGPGQPVGVRRDSDRDTAEAEVGLVLAADGSLAGYVAANDLTSRAIERDNPLYLPQAKVYESSCALGPAIVPAAEVRPPFPIRMSIRRAGRIVLHGTTSTARMRRRFEDLAAWLFRALTFPVGVVLLTGSGIVPDPSSTLEPGDVVRIDLGPLGVLENPVVRVGR